jgi:RimJ/RimL family protein N-acetyltransferase
VRTAQPLGTELAGVELRPLRASDAEPVVALMRSQRAHLTRHGDFVDEIGVSAADRAAAYAARAADPLAFGIVEGHQLVGSIELVPVDPPSYGLGYWLAEHACGRGIATAAVRALVGHAFTALRATDVYAGVTHGNESSVAVLLRAGFSPIADLGTYTRFHRSVTP